jgi:hypothetical protein
VFFGAVEEEEVRKVAEVAGNLKRIRRGDEFNCQWPIWRRCHRDGIELKGRARIHEGSIEV